MDFRVVKELASRYINGNQKFLNLAKQYMASDKNNEAVDPEKLKNSTLFREFQAEREEILRHKWLESEKAGYDIGFEQALTDWIVKHRSKWRKSRQGLQTH